MLAQNFKTCKDLRIPADEHGALIKILGLLEREELEWIDFREPIYPKGNFFNMSTVERTNECGSVACIGGWVQILLHKRVGGVRGLIERCRTRDLQDLYFPPGREDKFNLITAYDAAAALRNYLTLGEPRWDDVLTW